MVNRKHFLFWMTLAYIVSYIYVRIPEETWYKKYGVFHDAEYSLQGYVYYFCERIRWIIHAWIFYLAVPELRYYLKLFFWFSVASLVDYILFLNDPLAKFTLSQFVINGHIFPIGWTESMQKAPGVGISGPLVIGCWMIYLTGRNYARSSAIS